MMVFTITPTLGLAYSHLSSDAYTETGAAGMNLKVTPGDVSTF
jgi:Autotransporter beta-domain.